MLVISAEPVAASQQQTLCLQVTDLSDAVVLVLQGEDCGIIKGLENRRGPFSPLPPSLYIMFFQAQEPAAEMEDMKDTLIPLLSHVPILENLIVRANWELEGRFFSALYFKGHGFQDSSIGTSVPNGAHP